MFNYKKVICCVGFVCFGIQLWSQDATTLWVENTIRSMTIEEKIGQLFMIRAHSDLGQEHIKSVKEQIKKYHVGGLCFFQGSPETQAKLTNDYQALSKIPMMVAIDGEWGLGMRFPKTTISYPKAMTIGAIEDNHIVYQMGQEFARQMKRIGVHMNFGPVADVNNNPNNPVINNRSFGENPLKVSSKAYAYAKGMQDAGLLACAKHFPGHGDTEVDSHHDLPVISHARSRLDSIELMPFKNLSGQGLSSMMVAHIQMPAIDDRPNRPASLSHKIIEGVLRNEMNFDGLVFTDGLEMKGVTKHFGNGSAEVEAILAGNDVLLLPSNISQAFEALKVAVNNGSLTEQRINQSLRRILREKKKIGLDIKQTIPALSGIMGEINNNNAKALHSRLVEQSLTLVKNDFNLVPIQKIDDKAFASISIGSTSKTKFQKRLDSYINVKHFSVGKQNLASQASSLLQSINDYDVVLLSLHDMSKYASKNFGLNEGIISFIQQIESTGKEVILSIFGSPYSLKYFETTPHVLMAHEENDITQDLAAQALFGAFELNGKLPVSASAYFIEGHGIYSPSLNRLGFSIPERVGLSSDSLLAIDTIVAEMMKRKAAPGCQVLIAKNGKVVLQKSFGYHTYDGKIKAKKDDIYDLASVTKIMASTISIMKLHEDRKMSIYYPLRRIVSDIDTSNKADMIVEDVLAHHAGLAGWIPFYKNTMQESRKVARPDKKYYRPTKTDSFSILVADDLYMRTDYQDSIWSRILGSKLRDKRNYRYSDLGFYIMHKSIHHLTGQAVNEFANDTYYKPLGLKTTGYNPLLRFDNNRIPPTEKDKYFRSQTVDGYVHDMGAAMLGGVSGHAGLFSSSLDIAVLSQMLLNGGNYGGTQFLKPKTVQTFTQRYFRSTRRGIGFDMKELNPDKKMNMSEEAPASTFGHLGFTGTAVWIDPDHDIIFIFLSNRTYPSMNNNTFSKYEFRPRVQTVIYDALMDRVNLN